MRIVKFIIIFLMFTSLISCAHPPFYSAKEINGAVVDGETDKPLEGVVVVAQWIYWCPFNDYRIKIIETVTDKDGRYHIAGWGPRLRRPFCNLDNEDPELCIYKSGYRYRRLLNPYDSDKSIRESYWNGKAINLYKFRGDKKALRSMLGSIRINVFNEYINYKRVKKMVIEYMKTASEELGIKSFSKEMEKIKEREEKNK